MPGVSPFFYDSKKVFRTTVTRCSESLLRSLLRFPDLPQSLKRDPSHAFSFTNCPHLAIGLNPQTKNLRFWGNSWIYAQHGTNRRESLSREVERGAL
jgi:hypothetical protein